MPIATTNPTTGEQTQTFAPANASAIEQALDRAHKTFQQKSTFAERRAKMNKAADIFERDKDKLARLAVLEMGKTLSSAIAEVEKCAFCCRHYADAAEGYLAEEVIASAAAKSSVRYLPMGVVLAVMPWNFPYWQVVRFAAPALMAGNVGILKHASNVPQCALALEAVFLEAGFAPGAFTTLLIGAAEVAKLIVDPRVMAVTLTGSEAAGMSVGETAGRALKKCVLELGGSDPFIVMPSADIDVAVKAAVAARNINNGQSCIASKRFLVHTSIYDEVESKFTAAMKAVKVGDPLDPATEVGPLAQEAARKELDAQVQDAIAMGAKLLCGGKLMPGRGWFYEPTILADIPKKAKVYRDEVFGPVALLHRVENIDAAIALANVSPFGFGSSVWTNDPVEIVRFANEIEAGQTFVNSQVASDPRLPFGGVKRSGYGRELSYQGIREFCNAKTVFIK